MRLVLFASAREAAGRSHDEVALDALGSSPNIAALLDLVRDRYGTRFAEVLATARVWVNGDEPAEADRTMLADGDEVAVLPPVSGGADAGVAPSRRDATIVTNHAG